MAPTATASAAVRARVAALRAEGLMPQWNEWDRTTAPMVQLRAAVRDADEEALRFLVADDDQRVRLYAAAAIADRSTLGWLRGNARQRSTRDQAHRVLLALVRMETNP